MRYFGVLPADNRYKAGRVLTYSYEGGLKPRTVVTVPLQGRMVTGFVAGEVPKPGFSTKPIKSVLSSQPLPENCLKIAEWMADYYAAPLGEGLKLFAPSKPSVRSVKATAVFIGPDSQLEFDQPLTADQKTALESIRTYPGTTMLLHGDTGTGKTRVYLELARETLKNRRSVMLLTPEISLTSQLVRATQKMLDAPVYVIHSQLGQSERKKIWLAVLEADKPVVIIGPRSALFSPARDIGLIVLDEAHEPAYKQEQAPRYHTTRVASQMGKMAGAKVVLGTATPQVADYYVGDRYKAVVTMTKQAAGGDFGKVAAKVVDLRDKSNRSSSLLLSKPLVGAMKEALAAKKQVLIYLNRRGTARIVLCVNCGWQLMCPNCDIPLVYHGDEHQTRCHSCGHSCAPPVSCPECSYSDIIYKGFGTKALADEIARLFPDYKTRRFDSDNLPGERVNELYSQLSQGQVDILVGTQLLAKGFDLPKLGLVGIIAAETSMALPDFSSEERSFQLLYQVIGRVGRGHTGGKVILQTYNPGSLAIKAALQRDWHLFYKYALKERQKYRFPPYSYLMQLVCRRATIKGAQQASQRLAKTLAKLKQPVEIIGPMPSFFEKRGRYYYYQIIVKSKKRDYLLKLAGQVPSDWSINLDPVDLL